MAKNLAVLGLEPRERPSTNLGGFSDAFVVKLSGDGVTNEHEGEHLDHYPLQDGDVVVLDRGYHQAQMWIDHADRGVSLIVRYNPHGLNL